MSNDIVLSSFGDILTIRFARPEVRNPLSISVLEQLCEIVASLDNSTRKLIFTGTDDTFASGANLREISSVHGDNSREFALRGQGLLKRIAELPQTTVAAVNGYCFGGALDLALACDTRIASPMARFAHPGAGLGIITGWGGTQRLPRLVGMPFAFEMFFTAEAIDAETALRIGLVDEVSEEPLTVALKLTQKEFLGTIQE